MVWAHSKRFLANELQPEYRPQLNFHSYLKFEPSTFGMNDITLLAKDESSMK